MVGESLYNRVITLTCLCDFNGCKMIIFRNKNGDIFLTFAQSIDIGYTAVLNEAVLTSTHNV